MGVIVRWLLLVDNIVVSLRYGRQVDEIVRWLL